MRPHAAPVDRLLRLLAEERGEIGLVYLHAALAGLLGLALPVGVQAIIGLVGGGMLLQPVVILIAAVVAGTALAGWVQVLQLAAVERLQQRVFARLSLDWGARLPRIRPEALGGHDLAETVNRFFEVVIIQKSLAKLLTEAAAALLAVLFGLLLLTLYHPSLSLAGALLLALLGVSLRLSGRGGLATSLEESAAKYRVAHWLQELARRLGTFRAAGDVPMPLARADAEVASYLRARQAHFRVLVRQHVATVVFRTVTTGALLVLGTALVVDRRITLGQFVASELVVVSILAAVEKLTLSLSTLYDVLTSAEKVGHVDDLPAEAPAPGVLPAPPAPRGSAVEARGLTYAYPGAPAPAVADVALRVAPGERVAITGAEGSGESTLLALLAGLRPGFEGALTIDGVSARDLDAEALRRRVGYVEQDPHLFDGTLAENVSVGRAHVGDAEVRRAIELAGLADDAAALPRGLRTPVGAGAALPSHVARKLALARAVAGGPSLLLFDEFFHHLEPVFKRELLERLLRRDAGWTVVAVSHDPVYLAACDRIYVLAEGRVAREGTFESLLADAGFAARMKAQSDRLIAAG
ncbi:ATP-binding cassette domain-containing protein [Roseisolibacter sp. H3M3-2]|uniref:ATP-binding cassette domain-containing protein n=1 Tax=Roseisolibacter sp. H3M3-2 TaxID=3031323 RepID=UPI0023DC5915|nr:ATP-binding cassette domain-containing protein [Roseisolibacter sp. H3M3-2]MDF1505111.1 ATP-binding cassette domain-containing protein [Roseisolibacter sp. H3M3-2]